MTDYTIEESQRAAELAAQVLAQLEGQKPEFACHVLSVVMATLIANEVSILARGHVVEMMQERLADDVKKAAIVATQHTRQ